MKRTFKLRQDYLDALNSEPEKRDQWLEGNEVTVTLPKGMR